MAEPVRVCVVASDPVLGAAASDALRGAPDVELTTPAGRARVAVVVVDRVDDRALRLVAAALGSVPRPRVVLVAADLEPAQVRRAIAAGVSGLLRAGEVSAARLAGTVVAAAGGDCALPAGLLDRLVASADSSRRPVSGSAGGLRPPVTTLRAGADSAAVPALSERERAVLRLVADGHETGEIARRLCYSTRTVTGVVQGVTHRFQLLNRAHAVAFTLRQGLL
jgi:DNA-binding NarL/FixJ family response regulator